jgi:hypothetical protein
MTQRLVKWVGERSLRHTFTSIADEIGMAEGTIRKVFADHVAKLERTVKFRRRTGWASTKYTSSAGPAR